MPIPRISGRSGALPDLPAGVEIASGRSVNGKATFFKFISTGTLPNNDTTTTAHGITGTYVIFDIQGSATDPVANDHVPMPFVQALHTGAGNFMIQLAVIGANVRIETEEDWTAYTQSQVILEYYYA